MNASIGCLGLGMIVLFFTTCFFIRESNKHIAELKKELDEANEEIDYIREEFMLSIADRFTNEFTKIVTAINNHATMTNIELSDAKTKLGNLAEEFTYVSLHLKCLEGSVRGMFNLMEQEHKEGLDSRYEEAKRQTKAMYEASLASEDTGDDDKPYADIPGDLDEGFEGEESITEEQKKEASLRNILELPSPVYKWEFPTEPSSNAAPTPIIGEEYMVIGRDKSMHESPDTNVDIVSGIGTWKGFCAGRGYCGFDMDDGYQLDKVYAFIQLPSPSDVMEKVIDIRLKE